MMPLPPLLAASLLLAACDPALGLLRGEEKDEGAAEDLRLEPAGHPVLEPLQKTSREDFEGLDDLVSELLDADLKNQEEHLARQENQEDFSSWTSDDVQEVHGTPVSIKVKEIRDRVAEKAGRVFGGKKLDGTTWRELERAAKAGPDGPAFSVLVNTFQRDEDLKKIIRRYRFECAETFTVDLHVSWNEPEREVPAWLRAWISEGVVVDQNPGPWLTNRWRARTFKYPLVFQTDDDILYDCATLAGAFVTARANPVAIVGFGPRFLNRYHPVSEYNPGGKSWPDNGDWCCWNTPWTRGFANLVLPTKGSFMHEYFYSRFWDAEFGSLRKAVDSVYSCEDILMATIHALLTELPPVPTLVVKGNLENLPQGHKLTDDANSTRPIERRDATSRTIITVLGWHLVTTEKFIDPLTQNVTSPATYQYV